MQDGGDRAAHRDGAHDAAGERQGGDWFKAIGERHQEGEGGGAAEAGDGAEDQADQHAAGEEEQFLHVQEAGDTGGPHAQHAADGPADGRLRGFSLFPMDVLTAARWPGGLG
jgi:hypothetical protein